MFGIGGFELLVILLFGFLIFGPEKLPEIASTVGRFIARFREAQQEAQDFSREVYDPTSAEPFKNPLDAMEKMARRHEGDGSLVSTFAAAAGLGQGAKGSGEGGAAVSKAADAAATGSAAAASGAASEPEPEPRQETFAERRARYERERAARRAAASSGTQSPDESSDSRSEVRVASDSSRIPGTGETRASSGTQSPDDAPGAGDGGR